MIKHISVYELKNSKYSKEMLENLEKVKKCPFLISSEAYENCNQVFPNVSSPIFAHVVHIALFASQDDAKKYPASKEHIELVKTTDDYVKNVMTIDFIDNVCLNR